MLDILFLICDETMAPYEHLPIYMKTMELTIYFEKIVRNFNRYYNTTLGRAPCEKSRELV